jgi:hypothetical protein
MMNPPWQVPLPLQEYLANRIVIYYYHSRWIPIKFCQLEKGIKLYYQAKLQGKELLIFPPNFDPNGF